MQQHNRPLLPNPPRPEQPPGGGGEGSSPGRVLKKRRAQIAIACNYCRKRKAACDGARPSCSRCKRHGIPCEYASKIKDGRQLIGLERELEHVQADLKDHASILDHLRQVPEPDAVAFIRRLRSTPNVSDVLSAIRRNVSPHRPSDVQTARAILPETHSDTEFELIIRHRMAYPTFSPIDIPPASLENLTQASVLSTGALTRTSRSPAPSEGTSARNEDAAGLLVTELPSPLRDTPAKRVSPVAGPTKPQNYVDARLNRLSLKFWTKVPVSDEFAARAISFYLEMDFALIGWFEIDLFLTDLVAHRQEHCSAFLVSSFLCIACQAYAASDPRALSLSLAFLRDADLLWQADRGSNSHTTLAAMSILSLAAGGLGKDQLSRDALAGARRMAEEMNLLGVPHTSSAANDFRQMSPERTKAMSQVAWGTYGLLSSLNVVFYGGTPIPYPPILPVPGCETKGEPDIAEQTWPAHPLPPYMKYAFPVLCQFWVIVQEVMVVYLAQVDDSITKTVPLAFAESKYRKLLSWADTLVEDMARGKQSLGHVLIFWSLYHIIVLEVFRPFVQDKEEHRMPSFTSRDSTPKTVFDASLRQLRRIVFEYRTLLPSQFYSIWLNAATMHVGTTLLKDAADDPEWRYYFSLCIGYWKESIQKYPVFSQIAQATLCIPVHLGAITSSEAYAIGEEFKVFGKQHELAEAGTSCIIDYEHALSDTTRTRANELAKRFDELTMFDAWTTGVAELP